MTNKEPNPDPLQRVKDVYKAPFKNGYSTIWDADNRVVLDILSGDNLDRNSQHVLTLWLVDKLNEEWGKE